MIWMIDKAVITVGEKDVVLVDYLNAMGHLGFVKC